MFIDSVYCTKWSVIRLSCREKSMLGKFRFSAHSMNVENGRYKNLPRIEHKSSFCTSKMQEVEDKFYFLMCPACLDFREKFIIQENLSFSISCNELWTYSKSVSTSLKRENSLMSFMSHPPPPKFLVLVHLPIESSSICLDIVYLEYLHVWATRFLWSINDNFFKQTTGIDRLSSACLGLYLHPIRLYLNLTQWFSHDNDMIVPRY